MLDIPRDARWGRIAESVGEDPVLSGAMARAMVNGFQGPAADSDGQACSASIAACGKHYGAYGLPRGA